MTREEALEELDSLIIPRDGEQDKLADAFEMAIKALEQEPCDVSDTNVGNISETQESENTCDGCYSEHMSRVIKNLYDSLESEEISREEIAALLARGSEELCGDPCKELPSAQPEPSEITDEQAIRHLQSTGWMQNHDREMYESGLREKLADDSGSYDSLTLCEDAISRESLKSKLKEHHDFFVNAYGGFSNLPLNDKSRVDEISNCIAMVVNEPPVTPKQRTGHWITISSTDMYCSECNEIEHLDISRKFCAYCGTRMVEPLAMESEDE